MPRFKLLQKYLLLILLSSASHVFAQDYKVEMVFFTHNGAPAFFSSDNHAQNLNDSRAISLDDVNNSANFKRLDSTRYSLSGIEAKLKSSSRYAVLQHVAWIQPGLSRGASRPVVIHAGCDYSTTYPERLYRQLDASDQGVISSQTDLHELDGTVEISLGRYLDVSTDLVYRRPELIRSSASDQETPPQTQRRLVDYTIKTQRRMRSGEIHYLDHPIMGIIVEITPVSE